MNLKQLSDLPPWQWPQDAAGIIHKTLVDRDASTAERILAIELAGDPVVVDDDLAGLLMEILKDGREDEETRCKAVLSLGPGLEMACWDDDEEDDFLADMIGPDESGLSGPILESIQDDLCRLYRDAVVPETVRRRILEASVRDSRDWHWAAVKAAFSSPDDDWRLTAVFCMGYLPGFEDQIRQSLEDENSDICLEAVNSAVNMGVDAVLPYIRKILEANRPQDRELILNIIDLVPEVWPEMAVDLIGHLVDDSNGEIAEAALNALVLSRTILDLDEEYEDEFYSDFDDEFDDRDD